MTTTRSESDAAATPDGVAVQALLSDAGAPLAGDTDLAAALFALRGAAQAPVPSAALAALFAGGASVPDRTVPVPVPVQTLFARIAPDDGDEPAASAVADELAHRRARRAGAAALLTAAAFGATLAVSGVAAAHDALPGPVQSVVCDIVNDATPFTIGRTGDVPRPRPPSPTATPIVARPPSTPSIDLGPRSAVPRSSGLDDRDGSDDRGSGGRGGSGAGDSDDRGGSDDHGSGGGPGSVDGRQSDGSGSGSDDGGSSGSGSGDSGSQSRTSADSGASGSGGSGSGSGSDDAGSDGSGSGGSGSASELPGGSGSSGSDRGGTGGTDHGGSGSGGGSGSDDGSGSVDSADHAG